jgi:hypothetical protein
MRNPPNVVFLNLIMKMRRHDMLFGYNMMQYFFKLTVILSYSIDSLNFTKWDFSQFI